MRRRLELQEVSRQKIRWKELFCFGLDKLCVSVLLLTSYVALVIISTVFNLMIPLVFMLLRYISCNILGVLYGSAFILSPDFKLFWFVPWDFLLVYLRLLVLKISRIFKELMHFEFKLLILELKLIFKSLFLKFLLEKKALLPFLLFSFCFPFQNFQLLEHFFLSLFLFKLC